jgi:hypothetical protein
MKLTPRLVAKLLTQSYQGAVVGSPDYLKNNPAGLTVDPEFLALNPEYREFAAAIRLPDALVPLTSSDLTSLLWSWVKADPDASAFLAGAPDQFGMVINPNNKDLTLPTSTFPRNDQSCINPDPGNGVFGQLCTLDVHPFAIDMHDAGRAASRGDSLGRTLGPGPGGTTPVLQKVERQASGQRALIAVVDAATATRYGLPTASLRNSAGQFVAPTTASLLAGEAAMKPSAVPGVLTSDPLAADPAAYPLTALSYAVTTLSALDATVRLGRYCPPWTLPQPATMQRCCATQQVRASSRAAYPVSCPLVWRRCPIGSGLKLPRPRRSSKRRLASLSHPPGRRLLRPLSRRSPVPLCGAPRCSCPRPCHREPRPELSNSWTEAPHWPRRCRWSAAPPTSSVRH